MRIHRMTHVGFVTPDAEASVVRWTALFGVKRLASRPNWFAAEEGIHATMFYVTGAGMEPLQPAVPGTPFEAALKAGRGPFHMSFRVSGIREVADLLWKHGLWTQLRPSAEVIQMSRLWIDPVSAAGAHIEFIDRAERDKMMGNATPEGDAPVIQGTHVERMVSATHIVDKLDDARALYGDILGFKTSGPRVLKEEGIKTIRFTLGDGKYGGGEGGPAVDVVEVTDPDSTYGQIKQAFGCGVGAWTFEVGDLDATHERLAKLECWMRVLPAGDNIPRRIWVHPRSTCGIPVLLLPKG
jgi:catechol 2,3-dioxygenase-like lactoylglutathione lyase family enzyme